MEKQLVEGATRDDESQAAQLWQPQHYKPFRNNLGRFLSIFCYPALLPFALFSRCEANAANAKSMRSQFLVMGLLAGGFCHAFVEHALERTAFTRTLVHLAVFLTVDHAFLWLAFIAHQLISIFLVNRKENRLNAGKLHGKRVVIIGNGPSALEGKEYGEQIDDFDEVVRFNNFQNKKAGLDRWVGSKCTVHFSDGVLYPTFKEYAAPGATVVLSLFADRFIVAGSYFVLRGGADLETQLTMDFLNDPTTTWIEKERIESLKEKIGLSGIKHPTSGMLAIDYFVNKPGVQLPVVIHGFDFFMGPKIHYYDAYEPLYERINNNIGVNQHSPHKEKVYVEKLIAEGKVVFIKDLPKGT
jgi:hypothetical protein